MSLCRWQRNAIRNFLNACILALFLGACSGTLADSAEPEASKLLPVDIGSFHRVGAVKVLDRESQVKPNKPIDDFPLEVSQIYHASTEDMSADGEKLSVVLTRFETDSAAYSRFTFTREAYRSKDAVIFPTPDIGTASILTKGGLFVFKGASVLSISSTTPEKQIQTVVLGRLLAATLDSGEGEIPVLVKHLPNWESVQSQAIYLVKGQGLEIVIPNQPIVNEISFEGGTEAVTASY